MNGAFFQFLGRFQVTIQKYGFSQISETDVVEMKIRFVIFHHYWITLWESRTISLVHFVIGLNPISRTVLNSPSFLFNLGNETDTKEGENDVVAVDVSPSSNAMIHDIMFTPPGSALDRQELAEEVFAAKDLDFAIDDEGNVKRSYYPLLSDFYPKNTVQ